MIAKVYANLAGLAKAMRRDGSLENEMDFKDFSLGFSQGKATFDFVDVGHGKERADNKIKGTQASRRKAVLEADSRSETARWHLRNHNCKQVLLVSGPGFFCLQPPFYLLRGSQGTPPPSRSRPLKTELSTNVFYRGYHTMLVMLRS